MLSRRTARHPYAAPRRSPLGRALPALALGVTALALAVPTSLTATASPAGPGPTSTGEKAASTPAAVPQTPGSTGTSAQHLTAAAQEAGLEVGNATMGWRERGTQRAALRAGPGSLRSGAVAARGTSSSFTPSGVLGIDVASYQGNLTWSTWTKRDKDFAYIKATEGSSYRNPYFKNQYDGATKAKMMRGAYHFANPAGKAGAQARYFVKNGGGWTADGKTLPGVLDIEYNPYGSTCYGVSKKNTISWVASFTKEYKRLTGKDAVVYTTTDWWTRCTGSSSRFAATNPLWIARYGTKEPGTLPKGWKAATFWQYSADPIDQDVFPGKAKALRALAAKK